MGDDIGSSSVCFDFHRSAAQCGWVCPLRSENDLIRQSVTEPKPMPSPINYLAYTYVVTLAEYILVNSDWKFGKTYTVITKYLFVFILGGCVPGQPFFIKLDHNWK